MPFPPFHATCCFLAGLVLSLPAHATTNNLVLNGSFESGASNWTLSGQGNGVQYALTNLAFDGAQAMRSASRTSLTHHVSQTITSNLLASSNGAYYAIEFSAWVATSVSARCTLQIMDGGGTATLYLAEQMITSTGQWVSVRGGRSLTWQGTLTSASLRFEIGQITEKVYPPIILDSIRIVEDTDRDGLADDLDPVPALADANTNQLPDGWEATYSLPSLPSTTDSDGDGYSNWDEYWTTTDPTNALSLPCVTVNSNASADARALLAYIALLPTHSTQRVLVGQVVTDTATDYSNQVLTLVQQTGRWPAMLGVVYDMINGPINHSVITPHGTNYWNAGGLVHVQWNPDNPWNGFFSGNTNGIDFPLLFTPGSTAHSNYIAYLDEVAVGLHEFEQAGLTVLFRPLNECNSAQNWYQRKARADYITLYRWTFDYLTKSQGLNNVLWVYDALSAPHSTIPVYYYYPGDDVVDVFGVNLYEDDWAPAYDLDRLSRRYPKPLAAPEGGTLTILNGSFTNLNYIIGLSNNFPRMSYFNIYNSFPLGGGGSNLYSLVDNIGAADLFDHPWIVTRDELAWRNYRGPFGVWQQEQFTTNANQSGAAWSGDPDQDGVANLMEYAWGSDPFVTNQPPLSPQPTGLNFTRNTSATDITYRVKAVSTLADTNWTVLAAKPGNAGWQTQAGVIVNDVGDGAVDVTEIGSYTSRFWRLDVTQP